MQVFARVIVQLTDGCWSAWFSHAPESVCNAEDWARAMAILIDVHGSNQLQWDRMIAVEESSGDGYAEFLVPYNKLEHLPIVMSVN